MSNTMKQCLYCKPYAKMYPEKNGNPRWQEYYDYYLEFIDPDDTRKLSQLFPDESYVQDLENNICPFCKHELVDTLLTWDDFGDIRNYSNNNKDLLFAMIELRKKDVIEFEVKMQPFRQKRIERNKALDKEYERKLAAIGNTPKCPTCGSSNVHKISGLERGASVMTLGLFSKKINKSYKCNSCKHTW